MDVIDELLDFNASASLPDQDLEAPPSRHVAIVTCMDCRIDLPTALGLSSGEAHVLRNAGGVVTDDMIRSLAISQRKLGTREVMLVHHTQCGMEGLDARSFQSELAEAAGDPPPFSIGAFEDVEEDVRASVERVRSSPFVPHTDRVRGFVYDVATHALREVSAAGDSGTPACGCAGGP